jgi:WD40 repeat protein
VLVTAVAPGSAAERADIQVGDVIVEVGEETVRDPSDLTKALAGLAPGTSVRLQLMRGDRSYGRTAVLLAVAPPPPVMAGEPQLMLDTGGHMGRITGLAWTPDGTQIVSAGEDKVIRIWDVATGQTVRTLRGAIGPGSDGKFFAMALSPDGRWLAAGGVWLTGPLELRDAVRLYDFATGELLTLLKGHTSVVFGLAFSPDGRRLISAGGSDNRATLWEAGSDAAGGWRAGRQRHTLSGHRGTIYAVGFSPDGARAVTGSFDTTLRLWDVATGQQIGADMTGHTEKVRALAVHPKDGRIVSGSMDGEIRVWDGAKGNSVGRLDNQGTVVGALAFAPSGERLVSGTAGPANYHVFVWDGTRLTGTETKPTRVYTGHNNIVLAAAISPDGRWAATGGGVDYEIHIWDVATGERRRGPDSQPLTLGGTGATGWAAGISDDGRWISWGNRWQRQANGSGHSSETGSPLEHRLRLPGATEGLGRTEPVAGTPSASRFLRARVEHGPWSLAHRRGGRDGYTRDDGILDLRLDRKAAASIFRGPTDGYGHRAYSFTVDGKAVISGSGSGVLTAYDLAGREFARFIGHESGIFAVTPSADGRFLITGSGDQTIRLWPLAPLDDAEVVPPTLMVGTRLPPKQIRPIVTLFHGRDGEWVMWTPEGYYTGSAKGEDRVGWNINRGPDKAAGWVTGGQLRDHLRRRDVVERAIMLGDSAAAIREAGLADVKLASLISGAPYIRLLGRLQDVSHTGGSAEVLLAVRRGTPPLQGFEIQVENKAAGISSVPVRRPVLNAPPGQHGQTADEEVVAVRVPLAQGATHVDITARNSAGVSNWQKVTLVHTGRGELEARGRLHILAIGVDRYPGAPAFGDLSYAGRDAQKFAETLARRVVRPRQFTEVTSDVLFNGAGADREPTRANIRQALRRLQDLSEADTVAVFIAGHGAGPGGGTRGKFYFLPTDVSWGSGPEALNVIDWAEIQKAVTGTKAQRRLLFLDTCRSGGAYNPDLLVDAEKQSFSVITSADERQLAVEVKALQHGLFTHHLLQGLDGKAADSNGGITVQRLATYVQDQVRLDRQKLQPAGEQTPKLFVGPALQTYELVLP